MVLRARAMPACATACRARRRGYAQLWKSKSPKNARHMSGAVLPRACPDGCGSRRSGSVPHGCAPLVPPGVSQRQWAFCMAITQPTHASRELPVLLTTKMARPLKTPSPMMDVICFIFWSLHSMFRR